MILLGCREGQAIVRDRRPQFIDLASYSKLKREVSVTCLSGSDIFEEFERSNAAESSGIVWEG